MAVSFFFQKMNVGLTCSIFLVEAVKVKAANTGLARRILPWETFRFDFLTLLLQELILPAMLEEIIVK